MTSKSNEGILTNRMFKNFVLVTIFIVVLNSFVNVVDGIFILTFFNDASFPGMAGRSITNTLLSFSIIIPNLLMVGNQKRYANRIALGETEKASKIFSWTIVMAAFYSTILFFVNFFCASEIATFLSDGNEDLKNISEVMIKAYSIGLPFMFLNQIMFPTITIDGGRKIIGASLLTTLIFNTVGDILVIFVFNAGAAGIMLSTSIAHIATTVVLLCHFFNKKRMLHFSFHFRDIKLTKQVFIKGSTGGLSKLCTALMALYLNFMLLRNGGQTALSVWGMQQHVVMTLEDLINGILKCAYLIQYINFAEEDLKRSDALLHLLYKIIGLFTLLCIAVLLFMPLFVKQYGPTSQDEKILLIVAITSCMMLVPFDALMQMAIVFSGLARCNIIYFLSLGVFPFVISFSLHKLGIIPFIIGYAVGRSIYPILHALAAIIKYKGFPNDAKRLFFWKKDYGYDENQYIDIKINSIKDCMNIADKVFDFCQQHNIDKEKSFVLASCAEEMANVYVMSGFTRDKKKYYCSIKICHKEGKTALRLRDDCPFFVKEKRLEMLKKDPINNISYNIVLGRAKDVTFTNFFGVNNFIISL